MMNTRELFIRSSLRCTTQRVALFDTLRKCKSHPTAEELFRMVKPGMESLSLATVYNTLDTLCEAGLAQKLPTPNGTCRYDANTSEHLHIRIKDTGEIRDVPEELGCRLMEQLSKTVLNEIEREMDITIDGVSIQLIGRKAKTRL